jgi:protein tyrosine phosphatase (PTP) superfamily phosphohydrolase (DUF442 family)
MTAIGISAPASLHAQYERPEAPFGDKVSERVPSYHRAAPTVGLAGPLGRLGIMEAKAVGFRSILNLGKPTTPAGLEDPQMAGYVLLGYHSVPVSDQLPTAEQVAAVRRILEAPENGPVLMYGTDRDLVSAAWALARHASGVPAEFALQEGLTAGLRERLPAVRQRLGVDQPLSR